jgi:hypothetical protein
MKKELFSLLLLCCAMGLCGAAQDSGYHYRAMIHGVSETGFYNVELSPVINSHVKLDYSDLRIVNDTGKWIAHLVRFPNSERTVTTVIWPLPIIKKENTHTATQIIVQTKANKISNLQLQLKNTDAERYCTLAGSEDAINWFTINDSILISPEKSAAENVALFTIQFPAVNYKFYRLLINNAGKPPLNITAIGYAGLADIPGIPSLHDQIENPAANIVQKDSGKLSIIKVTQRAHYHFNKISLKLSGVKYFNRQVDLYVPTTATHSFSAPGNFIQTFSVSNNSTLAFSNNTTNTSIFYLVIHNEDNLALHVNEVKTFNDYFVVTAYLEKGKQYSLVLGNAAATPPRYDLRLKDIANRQTLPVASISEIKTLQKPLVAAHKSKDYKWMIWLCIGIAVAVLALFTFRLISEMNKGKK